MVWTDTDNIRLLTGLTTTDISDDDLESLIIIAQKEVLLQTNINVIRERIEYLDDTRKNKIDGLNTTFYIKNWEGNFIADYNYDLTVSISDLALVSVNSSGFESSVAISSVTPTEGKFTTTTAPSNVDLYVTYAYSNFNQVTPDPLLKLATEYLCASYAYMRISSSQNKKVKFGNVEITNSTGKEGSYTLFFDKYLDLMRQLNESKDGGAIWGQSKVLI
jgi:hypothetical protein